MARKKRGGMTRQELLEIINQAARDGRTNLDLSGKGISELPDEIGQLANLQILDLRNNQLKTVPESLGQLANLQELYLYNNQLKTVPDSLGQLANLQELYLFSNQLKTVPESLGRLANLQWLDLDNNQLTTVPDSLGQLANLQELDLDNNQLKTVPSSLARLEKIRHFRLGGNPLNPALQSAYNAGLDELRAYLRSLEEPGLRELLYEAKLVLVGEGDVGKTTLLKAMTGQGPREDEPSTHGVNIDVQALHLSHPEEEGIEIQLNAWDFGGQDVYRVTHQFFFSRRSVYLLVWEPRQGVQQCQVEDWLKLIRLRVGADARVIIVSTHCRTGERIARIDKPVLERDFGSMIVGFHEVDSLVPDAGTGEMVGVAELKKLIAEAAKGLEQMGMEFNRDWREARDEVLAIEQPRITYEEFAAVCGRHGLDAIAAKTLAGLMHDLGYIVYYADDERLKDDVVLQPEWLTKAIGFVLEDRTTQEMDGILPDSRLEDVWLDHSFAGEPRYESDLYPFFLRLMEKYDVSYRLEEGDTSLVAQHVPQVRPALPWLPEEEPTPERRRIGMVCTMDDAPPGLVPWMIVRTHAYTYDRGGPDGSAHRLHWQKGMFLRNKPHGEAVLELRGREFHVYAEAVWPEFFMNVLRKTLHKLITDNWPGMEGRYWFGVPCQAKIDGAPCHGRFDIQALRQFLKEGDETIRCQVCRSRQNIVDLLYGFREEDYRARLVQIEKKLDRGFAEVLKEFEGLESRIADYVMAIMQAIANEAREGPRLFTIEPVDGNWRRLTAKRYRLHLWCEAEGCQHPVLEEGKGIYEFQATREWVKTVAPFANLIAGVLRTVLPVAAPAVNAFFGPGTIDKLGIGDHLNAMKEATGKLLEGDLRIDDPSVLHKEGMLSNAERSGILALHAFLREQDPNHERLGLKRHPTYTGDYLWLCEEHYQQMQSKIPDKIP